MLQLYMNVIIIIIIHVLRQLRSLIRSDFFRHCGVLRL